MGGGGGRPTSPFADLQKADMTQGLWIGGEFLSASSDETIDVLNPYTEQIIGRVAAGTPADVERAVHAAEEGLQARRWMPTVERAVHLHKVARKLLGHGHGAQELVVPVRDL